MDDVAVIPAGGGLVSPLVDAPYALCAGIVLEQDASVVLDPGANLYVIGPGDLDGDGISDLEERDLSLSLGTLDADNDGVPNFAETDSDNDGLSDACEHAYADVLHPYMHNEPEADSDGDGHTDLEECLAGSDPTDSNSKPGVLPATGRPGWLLLGLGTCAIAALLLRKRRGRIGGPLAGVIAGTLAGAAVSTLGPPLLAATIHVDFFTGVPVESAVAEAQPGDVISINGASVRPWSGQSVHVNQAVALSAADGAVFLGSIPATLEIAAEGAGGAVWVRSYTGMGFQEPVADELVLGTGQFPCLRGERFLFTPQPMPGWVFRHWAGESDDDAIPLPVQVTGSVRRVVAVFGPPGPDLMAAFTDLSVDTFFAGDTLSADVTVANIGQSVTGESAWDDALYLSRDEHLDAGDLQLDLDAQSGALGAGADYTVSFSVTLPDLAPGRHHLLGVADKDREATDPNRNNNVAAVEITVLDTNLAQ
jgi:hypothetical protein